MTETGEFLNRGETVKFCMKISFQKNAGRIPYTEFFIFLHQIRFDVILQIVIYSVFYNALFEHGP